MRQRPRQGGTLTSLSVSTVGRWLAILRIYTGVFWLLHALGKFTSPLFVSSMFPQMLGRMAEASQGAYHTFMVGTVIPNAPLFANLVRAGELLVGISLLLGLFTRVGAIGGMFLALNYMAAQGEFSNYIGYAGLDAATFVLSFMNLVLPTGMIWGLDGMIRPRRR